LRIILPHCVDDVMTEHLSQSICDCQSDSRNSSSCHERWKSSYTKRTTR